MIYKREMEKSKTFPYQNLSLKNMPGEKWKDIPDFEGLYLVSNYGRIKSLKREGVRHNGGIYIIPERIRRQHLQILQNKSVKASGYHLVIVLNRDGGDYSFSVGRLVYRCFIKKISLQGREPLISYRDHDGRNLKVSNLFPSSISKIKLKSFATGRAISHLTVLSKPVTQFDSKGKPCHFYPSMYEAAKQTGFLAHNIAEAAHGVTNMYKGFFWRFGTHTINIELDKIKRKNNNHRSLHHNLMVRLGIKNIDLNNPPAYLNLSIQDIQDEQWKDVPGYEGLYQVSNYGRVKALAKITFGGKRQWMPEQIKRLSVDFRVDKTGNEQPGNTTIMFAKNGKKKTVSVSRFVYYLFVNEFDLTDSKTRIYYKDGNSLNSHYQNLYLSKANHSFKK